MAVAGVGSSELGVRSGLHSFEQLRAWQLSLDFAVEIYRLSKTFPSDERYGLTNQLRRAASSVPANIAEGFGRFSKKEKVYFYSIAYGSVLETKSHLFLAMRLGYIQETALKNLQIECVDIQKQINGLLRSTKL